MERGRLLGGVAPALGVLVAGRLAPVLRHALVFGVSGVLDARGVLPMCGSAVVAAAREVFGGGRAACGTL